MTLNATSTVKLNSGYEMPVIGFGVFQIKDLSVCEKAVLEALDTGYRLLDTARVYGNEEAVGKAMRESGIDREDIFLTTKVMPNEYRKGRDHTLRAVEDSLKKLGVDYIDLFLIHWPIRDHLAAAWEALQESRDKGLVRSIGVSNFTVRRFEEQFFKETDEIPAVNQIELHPFCTRDDVREYCRQKGIVVEAYSPLARAQRMDDPVLNELAAKYGKSVAQVMIRWQLEMGHVVIPKSSTPERIRANFDVFDFSLSAEDVQRISGLNEDLYTIAWRPEEGWI